MPDFNNLPLVLAGPILRRVEPALVSVWVALSQARTVELGLWNGAVTADSASGFFGNGTAAHTASASTIRIGEKLHLAVVMLDLASSPLIPGQIYSYNLTFGSSDDLNSLGLLTDTSTGKYPHLALGYLANTLPSFAMAPLGLDGLKIVHGSCRKAHGFGPDGLAALDKLIERSRDDATKRPHQLFLTGDQVYADDVASVLLPELIAAGNALLGVPEELLIGTGSQPVKKTATAENFPATWRQELCSQVAKISSLEAANHVLSFGEFCALYLFFWSNLLWPENLKEKDEVFTEPDDSAAYVPHLPEHLRGLYPTNENERKKKVESREHVKDGFDDEVEGVKEFRKTLPNVRRALANIPTYMIFDDHEVTDDWYLSQDWRDHVLTSPLGVNIIRNALLGYTLFQGWGNDPKKFQNETDYARLLTLAQQMFPSAGTGPVAAVAQQIDALFGFGGGDPTIKWHYRVPSGPTQTVVLDTRTRRVYAGRYNPPGLLSPAALDDQLPAALIPSAGAEALIVVSPAPVLGLALVEELLQPLLSRAKSDFVHALKAVGEHKRPEITGYLEWDMEAWALNPERFEALLARFQQMKKVVILAGDVHYAISAEMDYWKKGVSAPARIEQFVSSALKNEWPKVMKRVLSTGAGQKILHNAFYPVERLAWENPTDLEGQVHVPGDIIPGTLRPLLNSSPVLVPTRGWPPGTSITRPTDWSWRMRLLMDARPDDNSPNARPKDGQPGAISPDVDPAAPEAGYLATVLREEKTLGSKITRAVVYNNNLGMITFSGSAETLKVKHELVYQHPEGAKPDDPQAYTAYETNLIPTTETPPTIG